MRKIAIILLLSIYTLSVVGYTVKGLYCCDNLTSVKLSFSDNVHYHSINADDKSDCCKQKCEYFKIKDDYVASHYLNVPLQSVAHAVLNYSSYRPALFASQKINVSHQSNAPPLYNGVPLFITNCTYLI